MTENKEFKHMITIHSVPSRVELSSPVVVSETGGIISVGVYMQVMPVDEPTHQFFITMTELQQLILQAQTAEINAIKIGDDPDV